MTLDLSLELLCKDSGLQMSQRDATYCIGMSQMTVIKEMGNVAEYSKVDFVEMLEMIGRAAKLVHKDSSPLLKKIKSVLDELLKVVEETRREIQEPEYEEVSASDDDD